MSNIMDLLEFQLGTQSSFATAVTPTVKVMGVEDVSIKPIVESTRIAEMRGTLAPAYQVVTTKIAAEGTINGTCLYEDMPYFMDGIFGQAVAVSGAGMYTRSYAAPLGTEPSPRIFTAGYGDGSNDYLVNSCVLTTLNIKGESNSPLTYSTDFIGHSVIASGIATLNDRSTNVVMGVDTVCYMDAAGGTIGTTELEDIAFSFDLKVDTKRALKFHMGSKNPSNYREAKWDAELKLRLEFTAATKALLDAILANASVFQKLVRIKATSDTKVYQLDFSGMAESSPEIFQDEDGVITLEVTLKGVMDSGAFANWLKASVTNSVSALA